MLRVLSFAICLLAFGHLSNAQVPFPGQCPEVKLLSEFDWNAYVGIWYEHSKYPFRPENDRRCIYGKFEDLGNNTLSVLNADLIASTGAPSGIKGYAKILGPGLLAVILRKGVDESKPNYLVLGTDYKNYAMVYSCTNRDDNTFTRNAWILARERTLSREYVEKAKAIMNANNIPLQYLIDSDQDNCPIVE